MAENDDDDDTIVVSRRRLARLGEVLAFLSIEAFDEENLSLTPTDDEFGVTEQMFSEFARDHAAAVLELQRANAERDVLIEKLTEAVKALSTPILDVWDGVLTLPIIGVLDAARASEMTERLLERINVSDARCVIIDVTGVDELDGETAASLLRMTQAAQLLGAYAVVAGISPAVANQLVALGVLDDGPGASFKTLRSLKDALRDCLRHLKFGGGGRAR